MGVVQAMSACVRCRRMFMFNPLRVPSVRVNGVREPVCRACIEGANVIRAERGLPPITYAADAYDPIDEHELPYD